MYSYLFCTAGHVTYVVDQDPALVTGDVAQDHVQEIDTEDGPVLDPPIVQGDDLVQDPLSEGGPVQSPLYENDLAQDPLYGNDPVLNPLYENGPVLNPLYENGQDPLYGNGQNPLYGNGQDPLYENDQDPLYGNGQNPLYGNGPVQDPLYENGLAQDPLHDVVADTTAQNLDHVLLVNAEVESQGLGHHGDEIVREMSPLTNQSPQWQKNHLLLRSQSEFNIE